MQWKFSKSCWGSWGRYVKIKRSYLHPCSWAHLKHSIIILLSCMIMLSWQRWQIQMKSSPNWWWYWQLMMISAPGLMIAAAGEIHSSPEAVCRTSKLWSRNVLNRNWHLKAYTLILQQSTCNKNYCYVSQPGGCFLIALNSTCSAISSIHCDFCSHNDDELIPTCWTHCYMPKSQELLQSLLLSRQHWYSSMMTEKICSK